MQIAITEVAIQAATVAMIALKEEDTGPTTGAYSSGNGGLDLRQPVFKRKAQDR